VPAGTVILEENTATLLGMGWIHVAGVTIRWLVVSNVVLKVTAEKKLQSYRLAITFSKNCFFGSWLLASRLFLFLTRAEIEKILGHQSGWIGFSKSCIKLNPDL
jgi:hypothetical protein